LAQTAGLAVPTLKSLLALARTTLGGEPWQQPRMHGFPRG
jgi:hypothetical protein